MNDIPDMAQRSQLKVDAYKNWSLEANDGKMDGYLPCLGDIITNFVGYLAKDGDGSKATVLIHTGVAFVLFQNEKNEHKGDSFRMLLHSGRVNDGGRFLNGWQSNGAIGGNAVGYLKTQRDT